MIPKVFRVKNHVDHRVVPDVGAATAREIAQCQSDRKVKAGDRVAIGCGSRGISGVGSIVAAVVSHLRQLGAKPFVFPAMGCHGGGTSEGQEATLKHLGISEKSVGCPVLSEIEPRQITETADGVPVFLDAGACEADHLLVVNRVKPHSDFFGTIGSGLLKMLVIGCGKMKGADVTHEAAITRGLEYMLRSAAVAVLKNVPVLGGLGVIEGPTGLTAEITWVPASQLLDKEPELFAKACALAPAIPLTRAGLLLVDWMGKNISGCGIDPFVIGRHEYLNVHRSYTDFRADRIYVSDLTEESIGNADGIGMADATSERLVSKLDYDAIRIGVLTSRTLPLGRIPIAFPNDREAIDALLGTTSVAREDATIIRVKNTTELEYLEISENLLPEWEKAGAGPVVAGPCQWSFDSENNLPPLSSEMVS